MDYARGCLHRGERRGINFASIMCQELALEPQGIRTNVLNRTQPTPGRIGTDRCKCLEAAISIKLMPLLAVAKWQTELIYRNELSASDIT